MLNTILTLSKITFYGVATVLCIMILGMSAEQLYENYRETRDYQPLVTLGPTTMAGGEVCYVYVYTGEEFAGVVENSSALYYASPGIPDGASSITILSKDSEEKLDAILHWKDAVFQEAPALLYVETPEEAAENVFGGPFLRRDLEQHILKSNARRCTTAERNELAELMDKYLPASQGTEEMKPGERI